MPGYKKLPKYSIDRVIFGLSVKQARVLLSLKQEKLAEFAGISLSTLQSVERGASTLRTTLINVQNILEDRGIEFTHGTKNPVVKLIPTSAIGKKYTKANLNDFSMPAGVRVTYVDRFEKKAEAHAYLHYYEHLLHRGRLILPSLFQTPPEQKNTEYKFLETKALTFLKDT